MKMDNNTINQTATVSSEEILIGLAYAANLLFGLPINGYVAWLIVSGRQQKIASDFIPLNQVAVESLLCLSGIWYFLYRFLSFSIFTNMYTFSNVMFICLRPLMQSYLCLEQYLAIVHPVIFLRWKPLRYKMVVCCISWLTAITLSIVGSALPDQGQFLFFTAPLDLFVLLLMTFCCLSVLIALKHPAPGVGQRDQHRGNSMKKKAFKIILINLMYTTLSQLPIPVNVFLLGIISEPVFLTVYSITIYIFVITGLFPSMMYLCRVGKLYSKCNCL